MESHASTPRATQDPRTRLPGDAPLDLGPGTEAALAAWEAVEDAREAARLYDQEVFPWVCERMRRAGLQQEESKLAFVPVGTQPYSPLLAALANPAAIVVLLHTSESRSFAELVRDRLRDERSVIELRDVGNGLDALRTAGVMDAEYRACGEPLGAEVVVDITSGRKATVAAMGAYAAVRGFRQVYIEGHPSRVHRTFMVDERFVALANVRALAGAMPRERGLALLEAGAYGAAADAFEQAAEASAAGVRDRALAALSRGLAHWSVFAWSKASRHLLECSRLSRDETLANACEAAAAEAKRLARKKSGGARVRHAVLLVALHKLVAGDVHGARGALVAASIKQPVVTKGALGKLVRATKRKAELAREDARIHEIHALALRALAGEREED